jgi:hypothetical protein
MKTDIDSADLREKAKTTRVSHVGADFQLLTRLKSVSIWKYAYGFYSEET